MKRVLGVAGHMASPFIDSKLTPLIVAASILLGLGAVMILPREEEPQIVVPMIDVFVQMPGASVREVEERVTRPMTRLLWEIPGVEYIYATSSPGQSLAIVRFRVGEDEEGAIVRLNQKMSSNFDLIPPGASPPLIKPRSIDDVPVLALTLSSPQRGHYELRQIAAELHDVIKQVPDVSQVTLIGGFPREIRVELDPVALSAHELTPLEVFQALQATNVRLRAGSFSGQNRQLLVDVGGFLSDFEELRRLVVGGSEGKPVYLEDVARVEDGPAEARNYVFFGRGPAFVPDEQGQRKSDSPRLSEESAIDPAVTIAVAKRKGTNAINVVNAVVDRVNAERSRLLPEDVSIQITRNYGETAEDKSNELLFHMFLAIVSVSILIWLSLGLREAGIVALAIPVTLALTLVVFYLYGYTLNRVTLFALIFSIGILVDDAIVVVENIVRHYRMPSNQGRPISEVALEAVDEVGNPTILATFAVVAAILPMAFVRGLMGPYMRPIPVGASAAMMFSLLVAFVVTPWASIRLLEKSHAQHHASSEGRATRIYRSVMGRLVHVRTTRLIFLVGVVGLLLMSLLLFVFQLVVVKMLPFDNKSEFQVIIDMPEGTTLEETAGVARELGLYVADVPEVSNYQIYVGTSAPYNFNGLVRHYFLRQLPHEADIQVNLVPREERGAQSHDIAKRVRPALQQIAARHGANIKVSEVPPGPPVLQTLVAEIYGPNPQRRLELAKAVRQIFETTEGVVDVDAYIEEEQERLFFEVDREKAALNGIATQQIAQTLSLALGGARPGLLHDDSASEDVPILVRLPLSSRSNPEQLLQLPVAGPGGPVALRELVHVRRESEPRNLYSKNLLPVIYVTADVAGSAESPVYVIGELSRKLDQIEIPEGYKLAQLTSSQPFLTDRLAVKWDGEWHITYEVFRDLGLAFAAVLVLIYLLVVGWFESLIVPFVIMAAIPFSLVGILPAHWGMGAFFTATSMIGFIAGAGIVVRNSIILVDFIELRLKQGMPLDEAVIDAGAVRFRPMMLTAAAVVVGASVILFDPIFQGLALSLMAGEVASLLLSRMTVPVLYFVTRRG